jgi:AcrR family transcriptional regulator
MRADALQNRQRLLDAARTMFQENGLDVTVADIADAAGIGRGTVFRNFPTKDHLIAAVVSDLIQEGIAANGELLETSTDDTEIVFRLITDMAGFQQANRAVLEAVTDEFLVYPEMQQAHARMLTLMDAVLDRGKRAGAIRPEVTPMDVMSLLKGMCMNPRMLDGSNPDTMLRYLELVRAAISAPAYARPLRGSPPEIPAASPAEPSAMTTTAV